MTNMHEEANKQTSDLGADSLLLPVEHQSVRGEYRNYLLAKRRNYSAALRDFPRLWECFLRLDEVFTREFSDLQRISAQSLLPSHLFKISQAEIRVAFELAFSTCIYDAWGIVRSAIESAVHAHKIYMEPKLAGVWLAKDKSKQQSEAYKDAFERNKKKNLFPKEQGLERLHAYYSNYSEWGTHPTITAIALKHTFQDTEKEKRVVLHYFETDPRRLGPFLLSMLSACWLIENVCFGCFKTRLTLDHELDAMRREFEHNKKQAVDDLIKRFDIPLPTIMM